MLKVTVEILQAGDPARRKTIGIMTIAKPVDLPSSHPVVRSAESGNSTGKSDA